MFGRKPIYNITIFFSFAVGTHAEAGGCDMGYVVYWQRLLRVVRLPSVDLFELFGNSALKSISKKLLKLRQTAVIKVLQWR